MNPVTFDPSPLTENSIEIEQSDFAEALSQFDQQQAEAREGEKITGTVVSVGPEVILVDIGRKVEGSLPVSTWLETQGSEPERGASVTVSVGPRNEEGYYQLSAHAVERPRDWGGLQSAFAEKRLIAGLVTEQVKGGFRVDIGVPAFMPASRSGVREPEDMAQLVGQEIRCRITKLDVEKEDVVVDRRAVLEEEQLQKREQAFGQLTEGAVVRGTVRTVMDFGAFLDLGGIDGLLHVADMSYTRVGKASDLVKPGDELEVKVLKIDPEKKKISLGLKQLQDDPWTVAARTFNMGDRVSGTVSRLTEFGAFVELLPGVDGLIRVSELSWDKRVRKPGDVVKAGERVEVVILQIDSAARKIALGYKQVLGDPWETAPQRFPVGSAVEGPVSNVTQFGGFVDLGDGIEGMVHISDITNEKRLNHAREKLTKGQTVKAVVLEIDQERRRIRLGMKQLEPTTVDLYIAEHKPGDTVTGRLVDLQSGTARVELAEGVLGTCDLKPREAQTAPAEAAQPKDISSLSAMLAAKWKQGGASDRGAEPARAGQIRRFRISNLDAAKRLIDLEIAS